MNFNVLRLISSTKLLIACKRIKNNYFYKFRQNEEEKWGKPKQSYMYRGELTTKDPWDPPRTIPRLALPQFPLSRISHGCILCLLQRLAVFYKLHL